ncbi:Uncharacterised protein [Mycobacteroides abscessus]|nr:Uncharacterised protein [Mycobacteroides abscessus]
MNAFGTHFGAAFGDVAIAKSQFLLGHLASIGHVQRMHFELGDAHQVPRSGERLLVFFVVTYRVAGVLAQEAFDALAELLGTLHVLLLHPVITGLEALGWRE